MKSKSIVKIIGIVIVFLVVGVLASMVSNNKSSSSNSGATEMKIKEVSYNEYKDIIKSDDYKIVLLASPDCSHCKEYKPFVNRAANEYGFDVYYVNVDTLKNDEYNEIHNNTSALKDRYNGKNPVIPTPTTVLYKGGKEVSSVLGDVGYSGFINFIRENGVID